MTSYRPRHRTRKISLARCLAGPAALTLLALAGLGAAAGSAAPVAIGEPGQPAPSVQETVQATAADAVEETRAVASAERLERQRLQAIAVREAAERQRRERLQREREQARERAARARERAAERARERAAERAALADPRQVAADLAAREYGWGADEFDCLDALWVSESDWEVDADNPTSSAYGIPQALPGERMAMFGDDWQTNPVTQIRWGLWYIEQTYGTPCAAWSFKQANNWY